MTPDVSEKPKKRRPEVWAKPCPKCGSDHTRITHTYRVVRYCICLLCKRRWTQTPRTQNKL